MTRRICIKSRCISSKDFTATPESIAAAAPAYPTYPTYPLERTRIEVDPAHLVPGTRYLIETAKGESIPYSKRLKGIFKKHIEKPQPMMGIHSYHSEFKDIEGLPHKCPIDFNSKYNKYYPIDAERRALFNQVFRSIGHPDITFDNPIFSGPKVKAAPGGGKTIRNRRRSRRSRSLKRRNRSKRG
jgi:hypothetical protein